MVYLKKSMIIIAVICLLIILTQVKMSEIASDSIKKVNPDFKWMGNFLTYDEPQYWGIIRQYGIYKTPYILDPYGLEKEVFFFPYFYFLSFFAKEPYEILNLWTTLKYAHIILLFVLMYIVIKKLFPNRVLTFFLLSLFSFGFDGFLSINFLSCYALANEESPICLNKLDKDPFPIGAGTNGDSLFSSLTVPYFSFDYIIFFVVLLIIIYLNKKENALIKVIGMLLSLFILFSHPYQGLSIFAFYTLFLLFKIKKNIKLNLVLIISAVVIIILNSLYLTSNSVTYSRYFPLTYLKDYGFNAITAGVIRLLRGSGFIFLIGISWPFLYYKEKSLKLKSIFNIKKIINKLNQGDNFILLSIPAAFLTTFLNSNRAFCHIPLLFSYALFLSKLKPKYKNIAILIPLATSGLIAFCHIGFMIYDVSYFSFGWRFLSNDEINQLNWFSSVGSTEDYTVSMPRLGLFIPYISGKRVYAGHLVLNLDYYEKLKMLQSFFVNYQNETSREDFITRNNISYIIFDIRMRSYIMKRNINLVHEASPINVNKEVLEVINQNYTNITTEYEYPIKEYLTFYYTV